MKPRFRAVSPNPLNFTETLSPRRLALHQNNPGNSLLISAIHGARFL
jgi:hypothetical protein